MKYRDLFFFFAICLCFVSCRLTDRSGISASDDEEKITIHRYDKVQTEYIKNNSFSALQKLNMEYRIPTKILIEDVLEIGQVSDDTITQKLRNYYSDSTLIQLIADVEMKYSTLTDLEVKLTAAFTYLQKEIPTFAMPTIYTQISAFNESVIVTDTLIGISLDKYMGEDYPAYKRLYHNQQRRSLIEERIASDCVFSYLIALYPIRFNQKTTLLEVMLRTARLAYITQQSLSPLTIREALGYTEEEEIWCKENEKRIWNELIVKKLLNSTNISVICNMMEPSQYSRILGEKEIGRAHV